MSNDQHCVFCKIASGEIPASIVYRTESLVAFLDITPLSHGHVLLIPSDHYSRLENVPGDVCGRLCAALPLLGRALLEVTGAAGYNVLQNNGRVAGQVVPHVHFHVIPRQANDALGYRWNAGDYPPGRADEVAESYRKALEP